MVPEHDMARPVPKKAKLHCYEGAQTLVVRENQVIVPEAGTG
jgi:hypothetical protein